MAALALPPIHSLLQMWEREVDSRGVAGWVLRKTVELQKIFGLRFRIGKYSSVITRYVEDVHAIILHVRSSFFMVQLDSMQSRKLRYLERTYYPFTSFYTQGLEDKRQKPDLELTKPAVPQRGSCSSLNPKNLISG